MPSRWAYLDSSTFLKLYLKEKGSQRARGLVQKNRILSCARLPIECLSALYRKRRAGEIGQKDLVALTQRIRADYDNLEIVQLVDEVLKKAQDVTVQVASRALDAIHIASASVFEEGTGTDLTFVTSDKRQLEAAKDFGLKTILIE